MIKKLTIFLLWLIPLVGFAQNKAWEDELLAIDATYDRSNPNAIIQSYLDFVQKYQGDSAIKGATYRRLGNMYKRVGNYDLSLYYQLRALDLSKYYGGVLSEASGHANIGSLYYSMGDNDQAYRYFLEAYRLHGKASEETKIGILGQADAALNLATMLNELHRPEEARHFLDLSIKHAYDYGDTSEMYYVYMVGANIAESEGDTIAWQSFLNKVDLWMNQDYNLYIAIAAEQSRASLYKVYGLSDSVTAALNRALSLSYKYQNPESIRHTAHLLTKHFESVGDSMEAYQYLKIYQMFNDSLLDADRIQALIDAEQKYQNIKKSKELAEQEAELSRKRVQVIFLGSVIGLLLILSVVLVQNRNKTKRLAEKEIELKDSQINELMQEQELLSMDAMMKGQDEERQRIARDLHDRLGSILSTVKLHFSTMEDEIRKLQEKQHSSYLTATQMLDEAVDEVRKISHDLHSGAISKFGLKTALHQLIQAIEGANTLKIHFYDNAIAPEILAPFEVELYRIIQELLSNTLKHAKANEVNIQLMKSEGFITFSYDDNGVGMDVKNLVGRGIGLESIEKRVQKIKGRSTLDSTPGHGFTFIIEIPI